MATIEASRPTTRSLASITSHFFSTSAVLVEWVLPNMDSSVRFQEARFYARRHRNVNRQAPESSRKPPRSRVRYHDTVSCRLAPAFARIGATDHSGAASTPLWNRIGPGRMGDHLALSVRIDGDFADREPLADQINGRGLAEEIDRGAGGDRMRDGADLSKNRHVERCVANAEHRRSRDRAAGP